MGLVYTVILFMIVPLVSTLDGMDNSMIEAGYNLGGNGPTVLRRIIIPYAMPGIVGLHRRVHADRGQLPDADPAGRQEFELVHRADLRPVHHPLQLGIGRRVRLPAAGLHVAGGLGRPQALGPDPQHARWREADGYQTEHRLSASYRLYVGLFFVFLAAPLVAAGVFAFNDSLFPSLPWQGFTLDWFFNDTEPKARHVPRPAAAARALLLLRDRQLRVAAFRLCRNLQRLPVRPLQVSRPRISSIS
jgi:hypothetical protein